MITDFNIFETVYYEGGPSAGDYVVFRSDTFYYQENMLGLVKRVVYPVPRRGGVDIYFVNMVPQEDDSTWYKFERSDFQCWSKSKKELASFMKGKQFDL